MNMRKKIIVLAACLFVSSQVFANSKSDTEYLLNWAELTFPEIFSTPATTIEVELPASSGTLAGKLLYRGYPGEIYAGVSKGNNVYVLGGPWPQLTFINTLSNLINILPPEPNTMTPGNENCVTRTVFPPKSTKISHEIDNNGIILIEHTDFNEETTNTLSDFNIRIEDGGEESTHAINFGYKNGFVFISKITSESGFGTTPKPENGTTDNSKNKITTSFSPAKQQIFSPACEGQSVKYNYISTTQTITPEIDKETLVSAQVSETQRILAINVSKTTQAGTFNTVFESITNNKNNSVILKWVDIQTGITIAQKFYPQNEVFKVLNELNILNELGKLKSLDDLNELDILNILGKLNELGESLVKSEVTSIN